MKDLNEKALVENQKNAANILVITTKIVILQPNVLVARLFMRCINPGVDALGRSITLKRNKSYDLEILH